MDKKYSKLKKIEHKDILKNVKKAKDKQLYKVVKDALKEVEKYDKRFEKEDAKIRKNFQNFCSYLTSEWNNYENTKVVNTNVVLNEGDYPINLTKDNVFIGLNQSVWRLLTENQKMYSLQMFVDNVCEEFGIERLKLDFFVPEDLEDESYGCIIKDNKFNFDCRLFKNNVPALSVVKEVIYGVMEHKKAIDRESIENSGESTVNLNLYQLETLYVDEYDDLGVFMPRFCEENKHILNILYSLNRMSLLVPDYKDMDLNMLIEQYEYYDSKDFYEYVLEKYNLNGFSDNILEIYLKKCIIEKYLIKNEKLQKDKSEDKSDLTFND